jgi:hypothetical protein
VGPNIDSEIITWTATPMTWTFPLLTLRDICDQISSHYSISNSTGRRAVEIALTRRHYYLGNPSCLLASGRTASNTFAAGIAIPLLKP